jgi:hypothetical protein
MKQLLVSIAGSAQGKRPRRHKVGPPEHRLSCDGQLMAPGSSLGSPGTLVKIMFWTQMDAAT